MICLSDSQINDIGLGFVLDQINACTPFGTELVRKLKPFAPNEKEKLIEELDNIGKIKDTYNRQAYTKIFLILSKFKDIVPSIKKCSNLDYVLSEVELFELKNFLLDLEDLAEVFGTKQKDLGLSCVLPKSMSEALALLDPEGNGLRTFYIPDTATARLSEIRAEKRRLEEAIIASDNEESKGLLREKRLLTVSAEEDEELIIRRRLTAEISLYAEDFIDNASAIGRLDLLLQKGRLASEYRCVRPLISESEVSFVEIYNPYIKHLLKKNDKEFCPISVILNKGTSILTGANMGGKSVVLKTLTLNILLFQMGFFIFAEEAAVPLFDFTHLISEDLQSLDMGLSTFAAEIVKLNQITSDLEKGFCFVALDEFGRGTNPQEGAALVRALAKFLNDKNAVSILSTHYDNISSPEYNNYQVIGLKNLNIESLKRELIIKNQHLKEDNPGAIITDYMDYRLQKSDGKPPKDALNICKLLNLSDKITDLL